MESKTVLVTGGSGFIGSQVCKLLVDAGHNVINIDRKKKEIPGVTLYPFDLDNHQIKGVIKLTKPDTIIHLAAEHEVERSTVEPATYYANNVSNTISLLNSAVEAGVKNFIFSSSSTVYGDTEQVPFTEDMDTNPKSPYGRSKSIIESILQDYKDAYGLNYASLRYFNAAGADPECEHGYTQDPATHLIPILCKKVIAGESVDVFGSDYNTEDGTAARDFTHVVDISTAHLASMNYLQDGGESGIFNIGAGKPFTVLQVINAMSQILGEDVKYNLTDRRPGDVGKTCADISKASSAFGWVPQYTLSDILEHALAWENKKRKK